MCARSMCNRHMLIRRLKESVQRRIRPDAEMWRRAVAWGVRNTPESFVRHSPPVFGYAFWAALGESRGNVRETLRRLKGPQSDVQEIADSARVFANFASCLSESMLIGAGRGFSATVVSHNHGAHFKEGRSKGKGLILATAHTAGWDVCRPHVDVAAASGGDDRDAGRSGPPCG